MTSKEALEELNIILKTNYDTKRYSDIFEEHFITPIERDLEVLHYLANMFDNNTLYRVLPYEKAKVISDYIDSQNKFHPEIREVLNDISNEEWK